MSPDPQRCRSWHMPDMNRNIYIWIYGWPYYVCTTYGGNLRFDHAFINGAFRKSCTEIVKYSSVKCVIMDTMYEAYLLRVLDQRGILFSSFCFGRQHICIRFASVDAARKISVCHNSLRIKLFQFQQVVCLSNSCFPSATYVKLLL